MSSGKSAARQLPASVLPEGRLWSSITRLLVQFDPIQVRYVGKYFTKIVDIVARGGEQTQNPVPAIQLLANVILRLDPTSSSLTTTHYQYVRLCLLAQAYGDATAIFDFPIYSVPSLETTKQLGSRAYKNLCSVHDSSSVYLTPATGLTQKFSSRMYLEYFLMGGMCYMAIGEYRKALFCYEVVLVAPIVQSVASAVMVEAYKKWLLVHLLLNGTDTELPKAVSPNAIKIMRPLAKPYECLVEAFKSRKLDRLQAEVQEGLDIWQSEGNYGLVHAVLVAFRKFAIVRLGTIYSALTIEEVTNRTASNPTDIAETLAFVQSLISEEQLQAEVVPSTTGGAGTLRFSSADTVAMSEVEVEEQLAIKTQELQVLMKQILDYDHQMAISKDYIDWLQKLKTARDRERRGVGATNRSVGMHMQDEDMMEDL